MTLLLPISLSKFIHKIQKEVTASDATSVTLSGLDVNSHGAYRILAKIKNDSGSSENLKLNFNGDAVDANYQRTLISSDFDSGGPGNFSANNPQITTTLDAGYSCELEMLIRRSISGYAIAETKIHTNIGHSTPALERYEQVFVRSASTVTNITSVAIVGTQTNGIEAGSEFTVMRLPV